MKRKILGIMFALVLVLSFSLIPAVPANAATLDVPSGPYPTIQAAINAANPGDTINVAAGTYAETITFSATFSINNLNIRGESDTNRPVVTGGVNFQNSSAFSGLTLQNLSLKGDGGSNRIVNMGNLGAVNHFTMDNCVLDGESISGRIGVYGSGFGQSFTITNTEFKNILGWAVMDSAASGVQFPLTTVTFANNDIHDCDGAVALRGLSSVPMEAVYAYGNTWSNIGSGAWAALEVNLASDVHIYENTIDGLAGEGDGLQLWGITTLYVHENTITDCYVGIGVYGGGIQGGVYDYPGGTVHFNEIYGNGLYGIRLFQVGDGAAPGGYPLDALYNWWGDATGPAHADNPHGGSAAGDAVSDNVDFTPWYATATTTPSTEFVAVSHNPVIAISDTIQGGIDAALAGDTIIVAAGTYPETVVIDKQLTLQGAGSATTIIDATGGTPGIMLTAGGVSASQRLTIMGLTVMNSTLDGIRAYKAGGLNLDYVTLEDVILTLNGAKGMEIHNYTIVSDLEIKDCEFVSNVAQGLRTASNVIVDGMTITDSKFNGNTYGMYLQGTINGLTILRSEFNNSVGGYGGYMTEAGPLTNMLVEDSEFNNNVVGLMVWNVDDNAGITIRGTSFQNNDKWGVLIWGNTLTNVLIENSTVANNDGLSAGYYGIDFYTYGDTMTNVAVHWSDITGHTVGGGVKNRNAAATAIVDATANWWGDASGPYDSLDSDGLNQYNPSGLGDAVTEYVLYDAWIGQEGLATGGGWFIPEEGSAINLTSGGKATFGFVAKRKDASSSGRLEFQYHADSLHLKSTGFDWVNVGTTQAMFEGDGTINGEGLYKFRVRAFDGDKAGGQPDRFEIRIWTVTDNFDMPTCRAEGELGGGQIVVHKK